MENPNYADSPKDRAEKGRSPADRNCGASSDGGICQLLKRTAQTVVWPGEGQRAFASVVTAQVYVKKLKARVGSGEVHKGWRCLPNNCPEAACLGTSPAAYRGSYFRAHHNGFFCGRGGCPRIVRSTGDHCDGKENEGSTAACNKAFPFAHTQQSLSLRAYPECHFRVGCRVQGVVTRLRLRRGGALETSLSLGLCRLPSTLPPSISACSAPPLLLTASACLATLRPRALRGLPQCPAIQIQPKPI